MLAKYDMDFNSLTLNPARIFSIMPLLERTGLCTIYNRSVALICDISCGMSIDNHILPIHLRFRFITAVHTLAHI